MEMIDVDITRFVIFASSRTEFCNMQQYGHGWSELGTWQLALNLTLLALASL